MMKSARLLLLVLSFILPVALFAQEDFSADIVNHKDSGNQSHAKIYVTKDKWRIEGLQEGRMNGAIITNLATRTSDILMAERKMYMESPQGQGPASQQLWSFYHARNIDDACGDWLKLPYNQGGSCHKVGSDSVNGRSAVKYTGTNSKGETGSVWFDKKIAFPIKWENDKGGSGELQNIKEGSQPASLFEIPSDYQKFQLPAGMSMPNTQPH
ncbi:MAG: hypothetical protein WBX03_01675 [Terriglobales bacterium]|jgi:hypothetical protein